MKHFIARIACVALVAGACACTDAASGGGGSNGASYDGVWGVSFSYTVGDWSTGTIIARDCHFAGASTMAIGGALGSGNFWVQGTEHMKCSNAETDLDYNFGGYVDPSGMISGHFYYWGDKMSISFAGMCTESSCAANGSNDFVLTLTRR